MCSVLLAWKPITGADGGAIDIVLEDNSPKTNGPPPRFGFTSRKLGSIGCDLFRVLVAGPGVPKGLFLGETGTDNGTLEGEREGETTISLYTAVIVARLAGLVVGVVEGLSCMPEMSVSWPAVRGRSVGYS